MPLYGQHVTPRQAMTHLTFSQIEVSWTGGVGGGCKHSHFLTSWRSVPGGNSGNICSAWASHFHTFHSQFQKYKFSKFTATINKHLKLMTEL